jgi:hypothetical protein
MRLPVQLSIALPLALVCALPCWTQTSPAAASDSRVPVLVELFTSEGCSDCPPADRLLAQLDSSQPIAGVHAIVLEEHVTYWDSQGWRDPFSLDEATDRQKQYQFHFQLDDIFTPQMVVDGTKQFVGNDADALSKALANASATPKPAALTIENARWQNGAADFAVHGTPPSGSKLVAALAADSAQSSVSRGENAGHTLHHVAILRVIKEFNSDSADGRSLHLNGGSLSRSTEAAGPVRLIVFLIDHKTGRVLGVAEQTLTRNS